jgi:hypothetical protein
MCSSSPSLETRPLTDVSYRVGKSVDAMHHPVASLTANLIQIIDQIMD